MKILKAVFFLIVSVVFLNPAVAVGKDSLKVYSQKFKSAAGLSVMNTFFEKKQTYILNTQSTFGIGLNLTADFMIHENVSLSSGIQYLLYSLKFDSYEDFPPPDLHHNLLIHEIQIPAAIKITTPYFYCPVGFSYRYPFFATKNVTSITGLPLANGKAKVGVFESLYLGYTTIGIGKEFRNERNSFFIEVQYKHANQGNSMLYYDTDIIIRNSMVVITAGTLLSFNTVKK